MKRPLLWALSIAAAALIVFYCFGYETYLPGPNGDWSLYLLQARTFLKTGNLAETPYLFHPWQGVYSPAFYPAGHPFLLSFVYLLRGEHVPSLYFYSVLTFALSCGFTIGSLLMLRRLFYSEVPSRKQERLLALLLFPLSFFFLLSDEGFHVVTQYLSETTYLLATTASFFFLTLHWNQNKTQRCFRYFALSLFCASYSTVVRPTGVFLALAVLLSEPVFLRSRRDWFRFLGVSVAVGGGVLLFFSLLCRGLPVFLNDPYNTDFSLTRFNGKILEDLNAYMWPDLFPWSKAPGMNLWFFHPYYFFQLFGVAWLFFKSYKSRSLKPLHISFAIVYLLSVFGTGLVIYTTAVSQGWRYTFSLTPYFFFTVLIPILCAPYRRAQKGVLTLCILVLIGLYYRAPFSVHHLPGHRDNGTGNAINALKEFQDDFLQSGLPQGCRVLAEYPRFISFATDLPTLRMPLDLRGLSPSSWLSEVPSFCAVWEPQRMDLLHYQEILKTLLGRGYTVVQRTSPSGFRYDLIFPPKATSAL